MEFVVRYKKVNTGEYLKEVSPVVFTADVKEAFSNTFDILKVDKDATAKILSSNMEKIINTCKFDSDYEFEISCEENQTTCYASIYVHKKGINLKNISFSTTAEKELQELAQLLFNYINDIVANFYLNNPNVLAGAMSDALSNALGMGNASSNYNDNMPVDKVIEVINNKTKGHVSKPTNTLKNYVCGDILKEELEEIKTFMENYDKYVNLNLDIPKGILFKGAPGTGKTYAAKCIAGSTDCYFINCTASSLQGMYIGSGSQNIRELFIGAKELQKASNKGVIIFIDEIDSLGSRDAHTGGAGGEEDRTVNQLLAEMDGFEDTSRIMVMAATNYAQRLDDALLRSGRFSREINIPYPSEEERQWIAKFYFERIKMDLENTDSYEIASLTHGLSPADIKEIANESAILALRYNAKKINLDYINEAINKCITKNIRNKSDKYLDIITAHECGHVLTEYLYTNNLAVKVTNYSYGDAGGFTQNSFKLEGVVNDEDYKSNIKILLGGRAAEEVACGIITIGASSDLEKAKKLLYNYYKVYNFEHYTYKELDQIVLDDLDQLYKEVCEDLKKNKDLLDKLIQELTAKRTLYKKDLFLLLGVTGGNIL